MALQKITRIEDLISRESKKQSLYHYTSPAGVISIISKATLRFTDCMFLNDITEYNYIITDVITPIIQDEIPTDLNADEKAFLKTCTSFLDQDNMNYDVGNRKLDPVKYYVLCGSTDDDLLSMWKYYTKNDNYDGYSIGFNPQDLCNDLAKNDFIRQVLYGRIIYKKTEQVQIIVDKARKLSAKFEDQKTQIENSQETPVEKEYLIDNLIDDVQQEMYDFIQTLRLFYKEEGYSDEKEMRVVVECTKDAERKYVDKKGIIRPHIDINLETMTVKRITLSPSVEEYLRKAGLEQILESSPKTKKDKAFKIIKSKIKLRF